MQRRKWKQWLPRRVFTSGAAAQHSANNGEFSIFCAVLCCNAPCVGGALTNLEHPGDVGGDVLEHEALGRLGVLPLQIQVHVRRRNQLPHHVHRRLRVDRICHHSGKKIMMPRPHGTRREKRSKLGRVASCCTTVLFTSHLLRTHDATSTTSVRMEPGSIYSGHFSHRVWCGCGPRDTEFLMFLFLLQPIWKYKRSGSGQPC